MPNSNIRRTSLAVFLLIAESVGTVFGQSTGQCAAFGSLHVRSFDEKAIDVRGACTHVLSRTCDNARDNRFTIRVHTERSSSTVDSAISIDYVEVDAEGKLVRLYSNGTVSADGSVAVGYNYKCKLRVQRSPDGWKLSLPDAAVDLVLNENGYVLLTVSNKFRGRLCGLCGNYDGKPTNDVPERNECSDKEADDDAGQCWRDKNFESLIIDNDLCGIYLKETSASLFLSCMKFSPLLAEQMYAACRHDVCVSQSFFDEDGGSGCMANNDCLFDTVSAKESACRTAEVYAAVCSSNNKPQLDWRKEYDCPKACPQGSRYFTSTPSCPEACGSMDFCSPSVDKSCNSQKSEGCACQDGRIWSGSKCVQRKQCGCLYTNSLYYENGLAWLDSSCLKETHCQNGTTTQSDAHCAPASLCAGVINGGVGWDCTCPPEYFGNARVSCTVICQVGQKPNFMGDECEPCPVGTYQPAPRQTTCVVCPAGRVTSGVGSKDESQCIAINALPLSQAGPSDCKKEECILAVDIPSDLLPNGIPFGNRRHYKLYMSSNGVLTFGASYVGNVPESLLKYTFPYPKVAPLWFRQDFRGDTSSWVVNEYNYFLADDGRSDGSRTNSDLDLISHLVRTIGKAPSSFSALWALEANWNNACPYPMSWYCNSSMGTNESVTYQLVLATDGSSTYAMFTYPPGKTHLSKTNDFRKIFMGYNAGDGTTVFNFEGPDVTQLDKLSNVDLPGHWIFQLAHPKILEEFKDTSAATQCLAWYEKEQLLWKYDLPVSWPCPCSMSTAKSDPAYLFEKTSVCAVSIQAHPRYKFYQRCCYDEKYGGLLLAVNTAGSPVKHSPHLSPAKYLAFDWNPYSDCCKNSDYCQLYRNLRPADDCKTYTVPHMADAFGDPHFVTFDDVSYTYNPVGEFHMVKSDVLDAQIRIGSLPNPPDGTVIGGTFILAIAAKAKTSSRVHVELDGDGLAIKVLTSDGRTHAKQANQFPPNPRLWVYENVTVAELETSILISFENGYAIQVSPAEGALQTTFYLPESARGSTRGLMGIYDGVKSNDFTLPNGTVIDCLSSTEYDRCVHYDFGEAWRTSDEESIMWYGDSTASADYTDVTFVPSFLASTVANVGDTDVSSCLGEANCIFDKVVTGSEAVSSGTYQAAQKRKTVYNTLANRAPVLEGGPSSMNVTAGILVSWTVTVLDADGQNVTLLELDMPPDVDRTSVGNGTYVFTWMPSEASINHSILLVAEETTGERMRSPVLLTRIRYCPECHNGGECLFDVPDYDYADSNSEAFTVVKCRCTSGRTGTTCSETEDPCLSSPCLYSTCQRGTNGDQSYSCGDCPSKFVNLATDSSLSAKCFDIDECLYTQLNCMPGTCVNTYNSYYCNCSFGFASIGSSSDCAAAYIVVTEHINFTWPAMIKEVDLQQGGEIHIFLGNALSSSWMTMEGVIDIQVETITEQPMIPQHRVQLEVNYSVLYNTSSDIVNLLRQRTHLMTKNLSQPAMYYDKSILHFSWPQYSWPNQTRIYIQCSTMNCKMEECAEIVGFPICTRDDNQNTGKSDSSTKDLMPIWIAVTVAAVMAAAGGFACCCVVFAKRRRRIVPLHRRESQSSSEPSTSGVLPLPRAYNFQFPLSFSPRLSSQSSSPSSASSDHPTARAPAVAGLIAGAKATSSPFGPRWPRAYVDSARSYTASNDDSDLDS